MSRLLGATLIAGAASLVMSAAPLTALADTGGFYDLPGLQQSVPQCPNGYICTYQQGTDGSVTMKLVPYYLYNNTADAYQPDVYLNNQAYASNAGAIVNCSQQAFDLVGTNGIVYELQPQTTPTLTSYNVYVFDLNTPQYQRPFSLVKHGRVPGQHRYVQPQ